MNQPCNLCAADDAVELAITRRKGRTLRTVICRACGLVWSDPRPHVAREFYEHDYRVQYKGTFEPRPKHVLRAGRVALSRHAAIEPLLAQPKHVLDVGSGGGEFSYLLQSLGHRVQGVEPNHGYMAYSVREYGLAVQQGFVQEATLDDGAFELITAWHVLEHTEEPSEVLAFLRTKLAPGGTIVIEVPNVEATCQGPGHTFHEAHLYDFNRVTLSAMGARAGLRTVATETSPDGGNIRLHFQALAPAESAPVIDLGGNAERIIAIRRAHTPVRHLLSGQPLLRMTRRLARMFDEARRARGPVGGRALLDALYASRIRARPAGSTAAGAGAVA